jgi:hypothetical protein
MLAINKSGVLVTPTNSGKEIPVTGVIFMENIYAGKCLHLSITGQKFDRGQLLDDVIKFAIQ